MTVGELIDQLGAFDPTLEVVVVVPTDDGGEVDRDVDHVVGDLRLHRLPKPTQVAELRLS